MATFEFVGGSTRTGDSTFTRRLDNGSRRRVTGTFASKPGAGSGRRTAGDGGQEKLDAEGPSSFEQSYRPTFSERLISTFGLEELGLSTRATERFTDEEYDLIDGVLNEDAPTEDMEFSRRVRHDLAQSGSARMHHACMHVHTSHMLRAHRAAAARRLRTDFLDAAPRQRSGLTVGNLLTSDPRAAQHCMNARQQWQQLHMGSPGCSALLPAQNQLSHARHALHTRW